jgi:hypothetical protein
MVACCCGLCVVRCVSIVHIGIIFYSLQLIRHIIWMEMSVNYSYKYCAVPLTSVTDTENAQNFL